MSRPGGRRRRCRRSAPSTADSCRRADLPGVSVLYGVSPLSAVCRDRGDHRDLAGLDGRTPWQIGAGAGHRDQAARLHAGDEPVEVDRGPGHVVGGGRGLQRQGGRLRVNGQGPQRRLRYGARVEPYRARRQRQLCHLPGDSIAAGCHRVCRDDLGDNGIRDSGTGTGRRRRRRARRRRGARRGGV